MIRSTKRTLWMKMRTATIISSLVWVVLIICPLYLGAQEISRESFADYLFREGEYYRAITEYYRILHGNKDYKEKLELLGKIGLCYFEGADYDGYVLFYYKYQDSFVPDSLLFAKLNLYLGKSYYHQGHFLKTISHLESPKLAPSNLYYNEAQFLLGISYCRLYDWQNAIKKLRLVERSESKLEKITAESMIRSLQNFPNLPQKNPVLAGGLSAVLPGAGYAYCHRWGTAIASLLVNGLLAWTFADALKQDQYGLASLTGFLGIGWYAGNIRGSVKAARKYNDITRDDYVNSVLQRENLLEYIKN